MDVFFFTGSCHKFVVLISFTQIFILVLTLRSHCHVKIKHNHLRTERESRSCVSAKPSDTGDYKVQQEKLTVCTCTQRF